MLVGILLVGCIFCNGKGQEDSGVPQNTGTDAVMVGGSNVEIDTDIPQDLSSEETDKAETSITEDGPFVEDSIEEEISDKPTNDGRDFTHC